MNLETIIGLEIHIQLRLNSKLFSRSQNKEMPEQNTCINQIDLGHPGTLPLVNEDAVRLAALLGYALNMDVQAYSAFDRKHYFYPDLSKGYQITQYEYPICLGGHMDVLVPNDTGFYERTVRFERIHLEEDAAKSFHLDTTNETAVDYNRGGCALVEMVTKPDFRSPKEAKLFLEELQRYARYVGASYANMEKGHLRVDANISLRPVGDEKLYPKTEIKNLNSFKMVEKALQYETGVQTELWKAGKPRDFSCTVGWRDDKGRTELQRVKEAESDYRYFPEPDVAPVRVSESTLNAWKNSLPELPNEKRKRFIMEYDLPIKAVDYIAGDIDTAEYFERTLSELKNNLSDMEESKDKTRACAKLTYNWLSSELVKHLNATSMTVARCELDPDRFADLLAAIYRKQINSSNAQTALETLFNTKKTFEEVAQEQDLLMDADGLDIQSVVATVIRNSPQQVDAYKNGKTTIIQYLIGQCMKETKGKADPSALKAELEIQLSS